jgi:hypothetical protein
MYIENNLKKYRTKANGFTLKYFCPEYFITTKLADLNHLNCIENTLPPKNKI